MSLELGRSPAHMSYIDHLIEAGGIWDVRWGKCGRLCLSRLVVSVVSNQCHFMSLSVVAHDLLTKLSCFFRCCRCLVTHIFFWQEMRPFAHLPCLCCCLKSKCVYCESSAMIIRSWCVEKTLEWHKQCPWYRHKGSWPLYFYFFDLVVTITMSW